MIGVAMKPKRDFKDRFLKSIKPIKPAKLDANDKEIEAARPLKSGERIIIYDAQIPGFGIRVSDKCSPECKGSFVLVARFPGSDNPAPRRIGDYPAMSLATAREIAREWRADLERGIDPKIKEAERRRLEERRRADTFGACFEEFAADYLAGLRTGKLFNASVRNHVFPKWAHRPISEIRRADVNELVKSLRRSSPIAANRLLAHLKKFFNWAVEEEKIEASPAAAVKRPSKENKRDRVLSDDEIRVIWQACGKLGVFGRAFRLMLATAQRRTEAGSMTWRELDWKQAIWRLARERTKADRAHEIPLSATALSIIEESPRLGTFIFTTNGTKPIGGWSKAKRRLDELALDSEGTPIAGWHLHDLRRTAATHMAKLGVDRIVIGKVLNHAEGEVTAIYDRYDYDREKKRALDLWGERLRSIIEPDQGNGVVRLASARGAR